MKNPRFMAKAAKLFLCVWAAGSCTPVLTRDDVLLRPGNFTAVGTQTIQATVGEVVSGPARVRVLDTDGIAMPGQQVQFSATAGVVSPTSTTTNAQGEAVVESWTVPQTSGVASITASLPGSGLPSVQFTATVNPGPPVNISSSQSATTAVVNGDIAVTVTVQDQFGNGVPGLSVNFEPGESSTNASANSPVATNSSGNASSTWRIDTLARVNTLDVTVAGTGLTAGFSATGTPDSPTIIDNTSDASMSGAPNTPAPEDPQVEVTDRYNNRIAGVGVTFEVQSGGGTVSVTSPACNSQTSCSMTTSSNGLAKVSSWDLGDGFGTQELRAYVTNNSTLQTVFTVNTGTDPCDESSGIAPDDTKSSNVSANDCNVGPGTRYGDFYDVTVTSGTLELATTLSSSVFTPELRGHIYREIGSDAYWYSQGSSPTSITSYWLLGQGTHLYSVTTVDESATGAYTLTTVSNPPMPGGCGFFGVTKNISTSSHSLSSSECLYTQSGGSQQSSSRAYMLFLPANQSATVRLSGFGVDWALEAYDVTGGGNNFITSTDFAGSGGTEVMTIFSTSSDRFIDIRATHWRFLSPQSGAYTFSIDP